MKNVPLEREQYQNFRRWLRTTDIVWRDLTDASLIPTWNEAICKEDILDENFTTPGERAWKTIRQNYPKLNLQWRKSELGYLSYRPPLYFTESYSGELHTLDIQSAYLQIYRHLFLHSDWPTRRSKYPLAGIAKSLQSDKLGRNAVVGICRSTRNKWCQGSHTWYVHKRNPFLSPTLWGQIQCVLNQIARNMITFDAIYVNTDGYAFTSLTALKTARHFLDDYAVSYKVASGEGHILGISALSIPGIKEPLELNPSGPVTMIEPDDGFNWLGWWSSLKQSS